MKVIRQQLDTDETLIRRFRSAAKKAQIVDEAKEHMFYLTREERRELKKRRQLRELR